MKEKAIVEEQRLSARLLLRENPDDREKLGQNTTLQRKLEEALGKSFQVLNYIKQKEEHLKEQKKADQEAADFENQRKDESQEPALSTSAGTNDKEESGDAAYDQNNQNQDYPGYKNQEFYDDQWAKGYKDYSSDQAACSYDKYHEKGKENPRYQPYPPEANYKNQDYYGDNYSQGYKNQWHYKDDPKYQQQSWDWDQQEAYSQEAEAKDKRQDHYGDNSYEGYKNQENYKDDPKYQQQSWDWDQQEAYPQEAEAKDKRQDHSYEGHKNQENYKDDPKYQQQSWDWDQQEAYSQEAEAKDKNHDNSYEGYKNQENYKDDPKYQQQSWDWDQQEAYSQEAEAKDTNQDHYGDNSNQEHYKEKPEDQKKTPKETPAETEKTEEILEEEEEKVSLERMQQKHAKQLKQLQEKQERELLQMRSHKRQKVDGVLPVGRLQSECPEPQTPGLVPEAEYLGLFEPFF